MTSYICDYAAQLVGPYQQLWISYETGNTENQCLKEAVKHLESSNTRLREENYQMAHANANQEVLLRCSREAFQHIQYGILGVFEHLKNSRQKESNTTSVSGLVGEQKDDSAWNWSSQMCIVLLYHVARFNI